MEMHQLQIPMEESDDGSWRQRCYDRIERLKASEFRNDTEEPPSHQPGLLMQEGLFWKKNSEIFELRKVVQAGNMERFVDMLERLCSEKKLSLSTIFDQVTPAGDSLLHVTAYFGKVEIAELIGHHFPELLTKTNIKGDTPLHVAARERSTGLINLILSQYAAYKSRSLREKNRDEGITRMSNEYGNSALHEAVCSKHVEGVNLLFEADKCVAHYLNKSTRSPLYLAILSSSKDIVNILLEAPFPDDKSHLKHHGNSPLHGAIYKENPDLLMEIVEKKPDLMYLRDEDEGTPLHYAAATGYAKGIHLLGRKSTSIALEQNSKGHLPIHLACKFGHIEVLKEFLQQEWADPRILLNKNGQNILHVAAKNGREKVVQYLLKNKQFKELISINEKDKNGNTPLHLAAQKCHRAILFSLTEEKSIDVNLTNNKGLTAPDIFWLNNTQMITRKWLSRVIFPVPGAQMSEKPKNMLPPKCKDRIVAEEEGLKDRRVAEDEGLKDRTVVKEEGSKGRKRVPKYIEEGLKERMDSLLVVATLIVTVTFAAGFTIPGGSYGSDYHNPRKKGMPLLGHEYNFGGFIAFDIVAMSSSTFGATILLAAKTIGDIKLGWILLGIANFMMGLALYSMMAAFESAVYLIISDVIWLRRCARWFFAVGLFSYIVSPLFLLCWFVLDQTRISIYWVWLVYRRVVLDHLLSLFSSGWTPNSAVALFITSYVGLMIGSYIYMFT